MPTTTFTTTGELTLDSVYTTKQGIIIKRRRQNVDYESTIQELTRQLNSHLGCLLSSSYEYPNRYKRWDLGLVDPMLMLYSRGYDMTIESLNARGNILLPIILKALEGSEFIESMNNTENTIELKIQRSHTRVPEEERSKQASVFSVLRRIREIFSSDEDDNFGLYGAFGYDLALQFEPIKQNLERPDDQRDMVLFLPDRVFVRDHERSESTIYYYDFIIGDKDTSNMPHEGREEAFIPRNEVDRESDHAPGEYADIVRTAQKAFACGDLFETVPGQTFFFPCSEQPSEVFNRLKTNNPSPYGFFMNLGQQEYLVGASPEMFVRVSGSMVETCPISGTIARGDDALSDADQIRELLNSEKDHNELTMCTDVDRNDKSRICVPGSVEVIGRRQIELYSRLIHTVDHVQGQLREGFDALDAFLSHTWAVTVTGAPKNWAMQFIEDNEKSARRWYGGAVGRITFDGNINTGLTLRTVRVHHGVAEVRVGATLLYDSIPEDEDKETRLKASALIQALTNQKPKPKEKQCSESFKAGQGKKVLLVDHQDSFVNTLADYFRQTGADVTTLRYGFDKDDLIAISPDIVVLSPGPGKPSDFNLKGTIDMALSLNLPIFGVCLGLQGLTEYFGGTLRTLSTPQHGRPADIHVLENDQGVLKDLDETITVGRYHSIYADMQSLPDSLVVTAKTEDDIIMGIRHAEKPIAAVQFHPESIMSLKDKAGLQIINNVFGLIQ